MMQKNTDQRVGIFIDIQNLYHSSKNLYNARVNYKELIKALVAERKLIRAMAYVVKTESILAAAATSTGKSESTFFDALKQSGIELRMKDIQVFPGGEKKADWDVGMAIDAVRMSDFLDVIILVTGDGDFVPLVDYVKWGKGRQVEVCAFSRSTNAKLREVADEFIAIEEIPKVLMRKGNVRNARRGGNRRDESDFGGQPSAPASNEA